MERQECSSPGIPEMSISQEQFVECALFNADAYQALCNVMKRSSSVEVRNHPVFGGVRHLA